MWLLNTKTRKLEEFHKDKPRYAILSHWWENGQELTFGDLEESAPASKGYLKVKGFCAKARERRFEYVWVDTCCIDRKSSAELSEAINSMYKWYRESTICYVYLSDVGGRAEFEHSGRKYHSKWFDRGWTLQELLAPSNLHFFDHKWRSIGLRKQLIGKIQEITEVPSEAISDFHATEYCIAEKMSWFAKRETTREEDRAYCLLGLFDTNIPLLYGEGSRAFQRLQEEIMKTSTDLTLFLWNGSACDTFGMLASDPVCFLDSPKTLQLMNFAQDIFKLSQGWSVNNGGMSMTACIYPYVIADDMEHVFALYLHERFRLSFTGFVIFLQRIDDPRGIQSYQRVVVNGAPWERTTCLNMPRYLPSEYEVAELFIARRPLVELRADEPKNIAIQFSSQSPIHCTVRTRRAKFPEANLCDWSIRREGYHRGLECSFGLRPRHIIGLVSHLVVTLVENVDLLICLGLDRHFQPFSVVLPLCGQTYNAHLTALSIMKAYERVVQGLVRPTYADDPDLHMLCSVGEDGSLAWYTDFGLDIQVSPNDSGFSAAIAFRPETFIQHYLPEADLSCGTELACLPRFEVDKLVQLESEFYEMRCKNALCSYICEAND